MTAVTKHIHELRSFMGELIGPRPTNEIVITQYADNSVNYQFEGLDGPMDPKTAYQLLATVAQEVIKSLPPKESPSE